MNNFARNALGAMALAGLLGACSTMSSMTGGSAGEKVSLSGRNEVPPVDTQAAGSGTVTVNSDHTVSARIEVTGMTPTAAHIHEAAAGANGKVIIPFTKTGDHEFAAPAGAKLTDEQYQSYKAGKLYVNVHSANHPGGEIRAQLGGH